MRAPAVVAAALLPLAASCGNRRPEIPGRTREFLERQAGILAPAMVLSGSLAATGPDSDSVAALMRVCDPDPALYAYFYACLAESAGKIEAPAEEPPGRVPDSAATGPAGRVATGPSTL